MGPDPDVAAYQGGVPLPLQVIGFMYTFHRDRRPTVSLLHHDTSNE